MTMTLSRSLQVETIEKRGHRSYHSSSISESNTESPRLSDGECTSSTPTSIDDTAALQHGIRAVKISNEQEEEEPVDYFGPKEKNQEEVGRVRDNGQEGYDDSTPKASELKADDQEDREDRESVLDNSSLIQTDSYIQDLNDDHILLNRKVSRVSARRTRTQDSIRKSIPFQASKHSQILPVEDNDPNAANSGHLLNGSMTSLPARLPRGKESHPRKQSSTSFSSVPAEVHSAAKGPPNRSESKNIEVKKQKKVLIKKKEMRKKRLSFPQDDDRVLIGNKVSEGHVNFIIAYNMLTGIRVAVSRCSGIMKPLTPLDFKCTKKLAFDYHGNELTPSSQYAFKFKDYSPEVFRELRAMFGLDPADYLVSLTSRYVLSELNSPGKSGSFFYFSRDYKYIIKTIHHAEHVHLRKHLHAYYTHIKANPDTLICQFYGLHRVKMPISFQNKVKHRKIYFLVMNNLFPPHLEMHTTFDLKGSTWGRVTKVDPEKAKDDSYRPVLKDVNWLEREERIEFGPLKKKKFLEQLKKDVQLLAKLNTMDYSLLLGIHDMNKAREEEETDLPDGPLAPTTPTGLSDGTSGGLPTASVIPHHFKEFEGGIRSSDIFNNDTDLVYYVGIIDCLTNYSFLKKLETFWRSLGHDLKVVSAVPPKDYANRFYEFIADSVNALPPTRYKDNPDQQAYKD